MRAHRRAGRFSVVLVWIPATVTAPTSRDNWGEFVLSRAIAAGAWVVASGMAGAQRISMSPQSTPSGTVITAR